MAEKKADIILHPIRMRIIQCLVTGGEMTSYQLQEELKDIPQATLYRHIKKMKDAGVLAVADERPHRGALEKVYMLPEHAANITKEDLENASPEDHLAYFINFAAHLIGEYGRYVQQPTFDLVQDGVSYRQIQLFLSDEENMELILAIREQLMKYKDNKPGENRRKRLISNIVHPEASQ